LAMMLWQKSRKLFVQRELQHKRVSSYAISATIVEV
jgi:hypothetical protein